VAEGLGGRGRVCASVEAIVEHLVAHAAPGDHLLILSNGSFDGLHETLIRRLGETAEGQG